MEDNGLDNNQSIKEQRKKQMNRVKTILLLMMIVWVIISIVATALLATRLYSQDKRIDVLQENQKMVEEYIKADREKKEDSSEVKVDQNKKKGKEKEQEPKDDGQAAETEEEGKEPEDTAQEEDDTKKVYLTFDDGPSVNTEELLNVLDQYQVKATFFVVGKDDDLSLQMYKEIIDRGHTLAMHSYSHKYSELYASMEAFEADFIKLRDLLTEVTGVTPQFYRFPGGSSNEVSNIDMSQFIQYLTDQGVDYFDWNVSSGDAMSQSYTPQSVIDNVMKDVGKYKTSVVLMHDTSLKHATIEALPALIETLQSQEYVLLPIDETTKLVQHISVDSVVDTGE